MELIQRWVAATFIENHNSSTRFGIRNTQENFERLLDAMDQQMIISLANRHGEIVYVNDKFVETSGYDRGEIIGKKHWLINSGRHEQDFFHIMWQVVRSGLSWHGRVCNRTREGSLYWVDETVVPLFGRNSVRPIEYFSFRTLIDWPDNEPKP